ncbi:hypothetical protein DVH26_27620 [Paenibacillus sp. H1-7]|uniref:Ger(x)C family spore germination C-terminal domain-containing protein n=1 Tax=Paenibacillus sp. H1-7 TaxID=2282849 RepID=UPI001EF889DB|nr:Ger(x)C family spore germination C-terminal domain-containing protein [Paenibacillus sp. H1-7]ULL17900.1 hypothetical protein DVH26_27620 [Paenibacillus sp. H1-7]
MAMEKVKVTALLVCIGLQLGGCAEAKLEEESLVKQEYGKAPVVAVDASVDGQMKIAEGGHSIRALSGTEWTQVVLLGEAFVSRNGLPAGSRRGSGVIPAEERPVVALVQGEAGAMLRDTGAMGQWIPELHRLDGLLKPFHKGGTGRWRDNVIPLVIPPDGKGASMRISSVVMRGREPAAALTEEELRLLACLGGYGAGSYPSDRTGQRLGSDSGGQAPAGSRAMSCRTRWSGNGELNKPLLKAQVTVWNYGGDGTVRGASAAEELERGMVALLQRLQEQRVDPLDIGREIRNRYRGVWTVERWREAFQRAEIAIDVRLG